MKLALSLAAAAPALRAIAEEDLLAAWNDTLAAFLDPTSSERRNVDADLLQSTGLSPAGLDRGLQTIGSGMLGEAAAAELRRPHRQQEDHFSLVVLPANPPGLMLQSLLPALAARAPVLFKSSRAEPHFAPAFLAALGHRLPVLGDAYAAATWTGGDETVEPPLHAAARVVAVYGTHETIEALQTAVTRRLIAFGPKLSLGWVSGDIDLNHAACGMALDIALFDQRGCLSVEAALVEPPMAPAFAAALAEALAELARDLLALAGHMPATVRHTFEHAGVSRFAPAGQLQATDAAWRNGGIDLAVEFAAGDRAHRSSCTNEGATMSLPCRNA